VFYNWFSDCESGVVSEQGVLTSKEIGLFLGKAYLLSEIRLT
jgi:hypothetical protein